MEIKKTKADKVLESICILCLAGVLIYLIVNWSNIPEKVPMHYDALGNIDRWGSRGELLVLPIVSWLMYGFLSVVEKFPVMWNTGVTVTEENKGRVYRTIKYMIKTLKLILVLDFTYLSMNSILGKTLSVWFLPVFLFLVFGDLVFWIIKMYKAQ